MTNNDNQVWWMDKKGRLRSKKDYLYADIKGNNEKVGTQVIAWEGNNSINQMWTVEDDKSKSNLNGMIMQMYSDKTIHSGKARGIRNF